jgi:hypothetical protein
MGKYKGGPYSQDEDAPKTTQHPLVGPDGVYKEKPPRYADLIDRNSSDGHENGGLSGRIVSR